MGLFFFRAPKIGIDLGTSNTLVYLRGKGLLTSEPTMIARDLYTGEIISIGEKAFKLNAQHSGKYVISKPLKNGVIADYESTVEILKYFIKSAFRFSLQKPYVMISVPSNLTTIERRALTDATVEAGASQVFLIEASQAAAIGADVSMELPTGKLLLDIGGGTTAIVALSSGRVVYNRTIKIGGTKMDDAIVQYVRKQYGVLIGERTAEEVKVHIGSASVESEKESHSMEVKGRDIESGTTITVLLTSEEISRVMMEVIDEIMNVIVSVFGELSPEIAADLISSGIILTGGGAKIRNIEKVLNDTLQIPVSIATNPEMCVIQGIAETLKELSVWKNKDNQLNMR